MGIIIIKMLPAKDTRKSLLSKPGDEEKNAYFTRKGIRDVRYEGGDGDGKMKKYIAVGVVVLVAICVGCFLLKGGGTEVGEAVAAGEDAVAATTAADELTADA